MRLKFFKRNKVHIYHYFIIFIIKMKLSKILYRNFEEFYLDLWLTFMFVYRNGELLAVFIIVNQENPI